MDKFCEIEAWIQDKTKLFETAEIAKFTPEERLDYEHSLKVYRDLYSVMETKYEKGYEQGRAEGIELEKIRMAQELKADGLSIEKIAKYTGLSLEIIQRL